MLIRRINLNAVLALQLFKSKPELFEIFNVNKKSERKMGPVLCFGIDRLSELSANISDEECFFHISHANER